MNEFLVALSAVFSALAAGFAGWISWRQWEVTKRQLFSDLLPARLEVIEAVHDLRRVVGSRDAIDVEESMAFVRRLAPCRFLFLDDPGLIELLEMIASKCKRVAAVDVEMRCYEGAPPSELSRELVRSRFEAIRSLKSDLDGATELLAAFVRRQY